VPSRSSDRVQDVSELVERRRKVNIVILFFQKGVRWSFYGGFLESPSSRGEKRGVGKIFRPKESWLEEKNQNARPGEKE